MSKSNEDFFEEIGEELTGRQDWEKDLAQREMQRYADDRDDVNNDPFPNASNVRFQLSDIMMGKKKAVYSQVVYSSQDLATFIPLTPRNIPFSNNLGPYYTNIINQNTDFDIQLMYALDSGLQDGESWLKIGWDYNRKAPKFNWVENLLMIEPGYSKDYQEAPWLCEVIHMDEDSFRMRFDGVPDLNKIVNLASDDDSGAGSKIDVVGRLRERYLRRGINLSSGKKQIVLWQIGYHDYERDMKRIRVISPDDPRFDFSGGGNKINDREYPFYNEKMDKDGKPVRTYSYMYEKFQRELVNNTAHSSRGVPEICEEYEFLLTAAWRFKHNCMAITQNPIFTTPSGQAPGSTNNITLELGSFLPAGVAPVQWPSPPMSFDQEMLKTRELAEMHLASPDTGIGNTNTMNDSRTAREVSMLASLQSMSSNYELMPWKRFIRHVHRQAWSRIVQMKPDSLEFYVANTIQSLPPDALNNDYMIDVSWSGDSVNREYLSQKAFTLWQSTLGNPMFNQAETAKNMLEYVSPGQVQRFLANPQLQQIDMGERISNEIDTMVSINYPVRPKEDIDHYQAVVMTVQFMQARQHRGMGLDPQSLNLLNGYMAAHREMLKKTNPDQFKKLNEELSQLQKQEVLQKVQQMQQMNQQAVGTPQERAVNEALKIHAMQTNGQSQAQPQQPGINPTNLAQ